MINNINIPEEIRWHIFSFLSIDDVSSCEQVCKKWNGKVLSIVKDRELNRIQDVLEFTISDLNQNKYADQRKKLAKILSKLKEKDRSQISTISALNNYLLTQKKEIGMVLTSYENEDFDTFTKNLQAHSFRQISSCSFDTIFESVKLNYQLKKLETEFRNAHIHFDSHLQKYRESMRTLLKKSAEIGELSTFLYFSSSILSQYNLPNTLIYLTQELIANNDLALAQQIANASANRDLYRYTALTLVANRFASQGHFDIAYKIAYQIPKDKQYALGSGGVSYRTHILNHIQRARWHNFLQRCLQVAIQILQAIPFSGRIKTRLNNVRPQTLPVIKNASFFMRLRRVIIPQIVFEYLPIAYSAKSEYPRIGTFDKP